METVSSVTPSGVEFELRGLLGKDQDTISRATHGNNAINVFNEMLADCLVRLGDLYGKDVTPRIVEGMLSNDRDFALVLLRQFSLDFNPQFDFKYEWPIEAGQRQDKEIFDYSINFSYKNFPVVPYYWVVEKIEKELSEDPMQAPFDGYEKPFPVMFANYSDMLAEYSTVEGETSDGTRYKWNLLTGKDEKDFANIARSDMVASSPIKQRGLRSFVGEKDGNEAWAAFNLDECPIKHVEHIRSEITEKEGFVDTKITVQHQTNPLRENTVNIVGVPAFFFPSMGK